MKMQRTIVIRRDYLHFVKKYKRFEKRHKNMSVHLSPCFRWGYIFVEKFIVFQYIVLNDVSFIIFFSHLTRISVRGLTVVHI